MKLVTTKIIRIIKTLTVTIKVFVIYYESSSSSGARSGTDIGGHASPNISVIRQLKKI